MHNVVKYAFPEGRNCLKPCKFIGILYICGKMGSGSRHEEGIESAVGNEVLLKTGATLGRKIEQLLQNKSKLEQLL